MANFVELLNFFEQDDKQYNAFLQDLLTFDDDIPFKTEEVKICRPNLFISCLFGIL